MKLNKNFVQISLTALITSAVFVLPMANSETGLFKPKPVDSMRITWQQALDMQTEYLRFRPLRVEYPEGDSHANREDLKGFVFLASDLKEILNNNGSGEIPDKVYFQFGQEGEFGDTWFGFHHSGNIRLIAVGVRNNKVLNTSSNGLPISVFDKADPCPPMCPN